MPISRFGAFIDRLFVDIKRLRRDARLPSGDETVRQSVAMFMDGMLCTGVSEYHYPLSAIVFRLGGIDLIDVRDDCPLHQVPGRSLDAE
jgi:hypothetical protein